MSNPGPQTIHTILRAVLDAGGTATIQQLREQTGGAYLGNLLRLAARAATDAGHMTRTQDGRAYSYTLTDAGRAAALAEYVPTAKARKPRPRPITTPPADLQAQRAAAAEMRRTELAARAEAMLIRAECAIDDALMDRAMTSQELLDAVRESTQLSAHTIVSARRRMQERGEVEKLTCDHVEYPSRRRDELPVYRLARTRASAATTLHSITKGRHHHAA